MIILKEMTLCRCTVRYPLIHLRHALIDTDGVSESLKTL